MDSALLPPETKKHVAASRPRRHTVLLALLLVFGLGLVLFLAWYLYFIQNLSFARPPRVQEIALGDLNNDGYLDIFMANCCGGAIVSPKLHSLFSPDLVWLNGGSGRFYTNGQQLAQSGSNAVALGDLNGNGFSDAFIASGLSINPDSSNSRETPNMVWFNDGQGQFRDSGQRLGEQESMAIVLGDLNGNGFPDAVVGNRGPDEVWFNDGGGNFGDSGERLGDGHADIFVAGVESYQVWPGQGNGRFTADARAKFR